MTRPSFVAALRRVVRRQPRSLSEHIARLRWQVPLLILLLALVQQTAEHFWLRPAGLDSVAELLVYGLFAPVVVWLALGWIQRRVALKEQAEADLVRAHAELTRLNQRVSFLLKVSQRLGEAADEDQLAALALQMPGEAAPAIVACSMIRFDAHAQPMPVEYRGTLDEAALTTWHQHLSSQAVRSRCEACQLRGAQSGQNCVAFDHLPLPGTDRIVCLPLERHGRQFAILGLFLASGQALNDAERELLEAVAGEIAVAFESLRLRAHELTALYGINEALQLRLGFDGLMARILASTVEASHADAGLLLLQHADGSLSVSSAAGEWRGMDRLPLVESLAAGALRQPGGEPILANLKTPDPHTASVLCAPMLADQGPVGVIVLGSRRRDAFARQHLRLVSAIAAQAALLAENARLYAQLEHQAVLAERGRLAREMHDGLAQTLGYLKMRAGQIARWIEAGQAPQAGEALHELAQAANDAYLDLRAALDGLRFPGDARQPGDFAAQLQRLADTFERQSGLTVEVALEAQPPLAASAQAHLLSIVQESLTNIRKHAQARTVRIHLGAVDDGLRLTIQDDGQGFDAGQDLPDTRHGLRVMRERADLLSADLQVTSTPGEGTRVRLEWPTSLPSAR